MRAVLHGAQAITEWRELTLLVAVSWCQWPLLPWVVWYCCYQLAHRWGTCQKLSLSVPCVYQKNWLRWAKSVSDTATNVEPLHFALHRQLLLQSQVNDRYIFQVDWMPPCLVTDCLAWRLSVNANLLQASDGSVNTLWQSDCHWTDDKVWSLTSPPTPSRFTWYSSTGGWM